MLLCQPGEEIPVSTGLMVSLPYYSGHQYLAMPVYEGSQVFLQITSWTFTIYLIKDITFELYSDRPVWISNANNVLQQETVKVVHCKPLFIEIIEFL